MRFALQPGALISVAQLERLEPACPPDDPLVHAYLLAKAPGLSDCQQIALVLMGEG